MILMFKQLIFLSISVTIIACAKQSTAQKNSVELKQDCYNERKLERVVTDLSAKIEIFGDEYLIATDDARYMPCEVPTAFRKNGIKIIFSGEVKEVYPHERWAGLPLHLTKIRSVGNQ
jgi:hypothetical protein